MISHPYGGQEENNWIPQNVTQTHVSIMLSLPTPNLIVLKIVKDFTTNLSKVRSYELHFL